MTEKLKLSLLLSGNYLSEKLYYIATRYCLIHVEDIKITLSQHFSKQSQSAEYQVLYQ